MTMKEKASRARKLRMAAAQRLIDHLHLPPDAVMLPAKDIAVRMVPPKKLQVKVVTA